MWKHKLGLTSQKVRRSVGVVISLIGLSSTGVLADFQPKVAVVMCEDSNHAPGGTVDNQVGMSAIQMVGIAGLLGVPYETLTVQELLAAKDKLTSVWMSYCPRLSASNRRCLASYLSNFKSQGGSVLIDGYLGVFNPSGSLVGFSLLDAMGFENGGFYDVTNLPITVNVDPMGIIDESGVLPGDVISQNPRFSSDIVRGKASSQSQVLLSFGSGAGARDYLTAIEGQGSEGRAIAISNLVSHLGVTSPFDANAEPRYFDNKVLPVVLDAVHWLLTKDLNEPTVGVQLSHAPLTMIGRLDGDQTQISSATNIAMDNLSAMSKDRGINTLYGLVSSPAPGEPFWDDIRARADDLQRYGGVLGSHSATHEFNMSAEFSTQNDWDIEVKQSIDKVSDQLATIGQTPPLRLFINPGNEIKIEDYKHFASTTDLYLTHGHQEWMPYGSGVMRWNIAGNYEKMPVIYNSLNPDYNAIYHGIPYGTPIPPSVITSAIASQQAYLKYYQSTLGRGALYNQMWHDYTFFDSNNSLPELKRLFDLHADHVITNPVYLPEGLELEGKMSIAQAIGLSSTYDSAAQRLNVVLDFSNIDPKHRIHLSGMGLRVNKTQQAIAEVTVEGLPHYGFSDKTVMLPTIASTTEQLVLAVNLGTANKTHLTFASKALASNVASTGSGLKIEPKRQGVFTRFCVEVLNAADTVSFAGVTYTPGQTGESCFTYQPSENVVSNPVTSDFFNIDGLTNDWHSLLSFAPDPDDISVVSNEENISGAGNQADWRQIRVAHTTDTNQLFFAYENDTNIYISWGFLMFIDSDQNPNTGFKANFGGVDMPIGADYLIEGINIHQYTGTGGDWNWFDTGNQVGRIWADKTGEVFLYKDWIGNPEAFDFFLFGNNQFYDNPGVFDFYPDSVTNGDFFTYRLVEQ